MGFRNLITSQLLIQNYDHSFFIILNTLVINYTKNSLIFTLK